MQDNPARAVSVVMVWLLSAAACAGPMEGPPPTAASPAPLAADKPTPPAPVASYGKRLAPPTPPADIARAKKLLDKGSALYRKGDYEAAEESLKEAMTLYPFFAEANLLLGKIFLIRGAATLDRTLIDQARLMFEMAKSLDPTLRETDMLLELFAPPRAAP